MSSAGVIAISPLSEDSMLPSCPVHNLEEIIIKVEMSGSMVPMRVLESDSIESVKLRIQSYKGFVVKNQKLVCGGRELSRSNSLVKDYGVVDGNVVHLVVRLSDLQVINVKTSCGKEFTFHVEKNHDVGYVKRKLAKGKKGLIDIDKQEILFNVDGEGLKKGTTVGGGAFREVAAYLLDHPKGERRSISGEHRGFSGVPPTFIANCLHKGFNHPGDVKEKIGSLQMFMENNGSCEDMGPGAFPVDEVHKISVLDIRMANADRHAGNILVSKGEDNQIVLIPIDHGYCLPTSFEDCTFDWLYWPQARKPFNQETISYIKSLDAEEDIALLNFYGWNLPSDCARTLRVSTMLLKKGVEKGFTPFIIGNIMCRENLNKKSVIEEIVEEAEDLVLPGSSEAAFIEAVSQVMDRHLDLIA
ncbi:hypothetical protein E3N88_36933 [Mikania micrantha]|uniref:1-phosphatidylinositol 4-kinase n=1 Tax=Mikania micrantha TaxID=192012 RepID=A0A5N6M7T8_9ASTR|nr:hypothetical protein E3N88_36933 [Mikania micrantha]